MITNAHSTSGTPVAIVTGGSRGIARAVARKLAIGDYAVVISYLNSQPAADAAVEEILAAHGCAVAVRADVADELDVERLFGEAIDAFGGVDVVVHGDARGTSVVNQQASRQLRDGGAIVNFTSSGKGDVDAITPVLARELSARDITVNAIALGPERPTPAHIANLVAFLVSEDGHRLNGQVIWARAMDQGCQRARRTTRSATLICVNTKPWKDIMSTTDVSGETSPEVPEPATIDMKLEVVNVPVSDVDRAKRFYESLGWRLDGDFAVGEDFRAVQYTPLHSQCAITFGKGVTTAAPGSLQDLMLIVDDIDAARDDLISRGVDVSEIYHYETRPFHSAGTDARAPGADPQGRSYFTWASFSDPDGNGWLMQEIKTRLPGREWED